MELLFMQAFNMASEQAGIPASVRDALANALYSCRDETNRKAGKAVVGIMPTTWEWADGKRFVVEYDGGKETFEQLCAAFAGHVIGLWYYLGQAQRGVRVVRAMPYLLLLPGSTAKPCPHHADKYPLVLPVAHTYWRSHHPHCTVFCRCHVRQITQREYDKFQREGVPVSAGHIKDSKGLPTGRVKIVHRPMITSP